MKKKIILRLTVTAGALLLVGSVGRQSKAPGPTPPIGIFEDHQDVGTVIQQGSVEYDPGKRAYTLAGSGENMWFANDAFQFVWKKASGDMALTADISFLGNGGNEHRKAVLMVRQDLDANSVYADVALHGNGLTSLQYRDEKGGTTHEIQANLSAPKRLRIEKHGAYVYMLLAPDGSAPTPSRSVHSGSSTRNVLRRDRSVLPRQGRYGESRLLKRQFRNDEVEWECAANSLQLTRNN